MKQSKKQAKLLERRIHDYFDMLAKASASKNMTGYHKPGSNKK